MYRLIDVTYQLNYFKFIFFKCSFLLLILLNLFIVFSSSHFDTPTFHRIQLFVSSDFLSYWSFRLIRLFVSQGSVLVQFVSYF